MTIGATKYLSPIPPYRYDAIARNGAPIVIRVARCEFERSWNNFWINSALVQMIVGETNPNHQNRPMPGHGIRTVTILVPGPRCDEPTVMTWIPNETSSPVMGSISSF
jgi:hypothetical protein